MTSLVPNFAAPGWSFSGCGPGDPPLVSSGSGNGRAIFDLGAGGIPAGLYAYGLTVDETDGNTGFVVTVAGVNSFPVGSDSPGTFTGTITVTDPPADNLIRLQSNMNGYKVSAFEVMGPS